MMDRRALQDYTLEELREAYDGVDTAIIFAAPDAAIVLRIGDETVTTTARELGEAKLIKRGWVNRGPKRRPARGRRVR